MNDLTSDRGGTSTLKCVFYEIIENMYMLMFPRYFRYSIGLRVESTGTGGDRSIKSSYSRRLLTSFLC